MIPSAQNITESETSVLNKLLDTSRYDKRFPPSGPNSVKVETSVTIVKFEKFSTLEQKLTVQLIYQRVYNDSRLSFSNKTGLEYIALADPSPIWIPSGTFQHVTDLKTYEQALKIYPSGKVDFTELLYFTVTCPMYLKYFPFDVQRCQIKIRNCK